MYMRTKIPSIKGYRIQKAFKKDTFKRDLKLHITPVTKELEEFKYHHFELKLDALEQGYHMDKIMLTNSRAYMFKKDYGNHDIIIYQIHGGAYITPISENNVKGSILYSKYNGNCDVFSLDYRVASQAPFPAALDDALEGYLYLINNGYNPKNIIIAGHSAGGGLAIALAMKLRDEKIEAPRCLVLASPWADLTQSGDSYVYNRHKDVLFGSNRKEAEHEIALPTLYSEDLTNPYVSPIFGDFKNLPPMLIQTGSYEMLLSDSISIEERIKENGGIVKLFVYKAMWHDFYTKRDDFKEAKIAWNEISQFIKGR